MEEEDQNREKYFGHSKKRIILILKMIQFK